MADEQTEAATVDCVPLPLTVLIGGEDEWVVASFWVEPVLRRYRTAWLPHVSFRNHAGERLRVQFGKRRWSRQAAITWLWERREDMYCAVPTYRDAWDSDPVPEATP